MKTKARVQSKDEERVTFVIQAQYDINVLLSVVALFNELKVQIEAIWVVRGKHPGNPHISVTVETNDEGRHKIRNDVSKVLGVLSVTTRTGETALIGALSGCARGAE